MDATHSQIEQQLQQIKKTKKKAARRIPNMEERPSS